MYALYMRRINLSAVERRRYTVTFDGCFSQMPTTHRVCHRVHTTLPTLTNAVLLTVGKVGLFAWSCN